VTGGRRGAQLADQVVHVPEAVGKHRVVRGLAELLDVSLRRSQQTGSMQEPAAPLSGLLLGPLPPLEPDLDPLVNAETGCRDGRFGTTGIGARP
jgi:hypothetical protein